MKIHPQDIANVAQPQKLHNKQANSASPFDAILEKAMTPHSGQASPAGAIPPLQSISSLSFVAPADGERSKTVKEIDTFLHLIESYQGKMADPTCSLKEIYPLVQQMEKKSAELLPALDALPDGDSLKDILNRTLIASTVEAIKFNRGDYV